MNTRSSCFVVAALLAALPTVVSGQQAATGNRQLPAADRQPPADNRQLTTNRSFALETLQQAAIDTDPRAREVQLLASQSELRLKNIAVGRLPSVNVQGQGQYQSDVPHLSLTLPGTAQPLISPPKATVDGYVGVDQRLFDPTLGAQSRLEHAQLDENQARVRTTLFTLRQQVNDAFFAAAGLQERAGALAATIADLETRLRETDARVTDGTALPADSAAVEATLLERRQDASQIVADRRAALARLSTLTGQSLGETDTLALPDLADAVARARSAPDTRARPEYEQFARTRDRIARQQEVASAQEKPRLSAYGRLGYGKPGLNFISNQFESYGLAGVRLQWNAWTWGSADREREALAIQQQVVAADEEAFTKSIGVANESDLDTIDRLRDALTLDDRIVMLRELVERSAQVRFQEAVVTASEYLDRSTELLQARFARAGHEVELAQASARLLTTLGLEVR
jgi:outer membrane protein TolC